MQASKLPRDDDVKVAPPPDGLVGVERVSSPDWRPPAAAAAAASCLRLALGFFLREAVGSGVAVWS